MDIIIVSIIVGILLLPVTRITGLSTRVSVITSRILAVLAYIIIFLVGLISGSVIRSPMMALNIVMLGLSMSIVAMFSSLVVAIAITKYFRLHYVAVKDSNNLSSISTVFTPLHVVIVLTVGGMLGAVISHVSRDIINDILYYLVAVLVLAAILSLSPELGDIGKSLNLISLGVVFAVITMVSSGVSMLVFYPITSIEPRILIAIGAASGWYSLIGPVLATLNPLYGLVGFLANMFRESLHILLYPLISSRGHTLPGVAMGGATSMDTGLPIIAIYGDKVAVLTGMVQGVIITLIAPLVISLLV